MHRLIEDALFTEQVAKIADIPRAREALEGIKWAISLKPEDFPVLETTERLRLVKSEKLASKNGSFVRLNVWFAMKDPHTIELLELEIVPIPAYPYVM